MSLLVDLLIMSTVLARSNITGTILGITETATGFPPNNLLMTSV